jgi:AraC-like DNA-binding protein
VADPQPGLPAGLREAGEDAFWTQELCRRFRPLSFWLIRWKDLKLGKLSWREVGEEGPLERGYHAEIRFGREGDRDAHLLKCLRQVARTGKPLRATLHGLHDFFYPLYPGKKGDGVIYATQYLDQPLAADHCRRAWTALTGRGASGADPEYARFARVLGAMPVLDAPAEQALEAHLDYFAAFLRGEPRLKSRRERALDLRARALLPGLLPADWVRLALGLDSWRPAPWHYEQGIAPWVTEELGITRIPNACVALAPSFAAGQLQDPVERGLELRRFQREASQWARGQGEAVAAPWEEHAVSLLLHAPGKGDAALRRPRELAQAARAWCRSRFGWRLRAGIGPVQRSGEILGPSWRAALAALHQAVALDQEQREGAGARPPLSARGAWLELRAAIGGGGDNVRAAIEQTLQAVLAEGEGRLDYCRGLLIAGWQELQARSGAKGPEHALQSASDLPQLLAAFREAALDLGLRLALGQAAPRALRLRQALRFVDEHLAEPLRLGAVAGRFGFSVPVFCRHWKEATGETFLGRLQRLRAQRAAELLRGGRLGLESVAGRSGFASVPALIRAFRKTHGMTPGAYREKKSWRFAKDETISKK